MSSTPTQRFVCPRCRSSFLASTRYCAECGADMHRASALDLAARSDAAMARTATDSGDVVREIPDDDRRLGEANRQWLGKLVDGRYRVIDVIGRGGMGVVYKVEHVRMGKIAAMKVLHRDLAQDADVIQRFQREAHAVSQLVHPNTVQVFDFGTAHDALYLIMELVRGQDLQRILDRDGPMRWSRLGPLMIQIGGALQEAHEMGIIHRDLKPENVLVSRTTGGRDFAKVLDFGLAKLGSREQQRPDVTDRAQIVGTPYFMAPEQIRGDDVDARTDVYALGAMMFRALTGVPLFDARTAVGVLTKHLTVAADAPSQRAPGQGIAPQVDHICVRALAKDPKDRWSSVTEMTAAIEEAYAELVSEASSGGRPIARASISGVRGGDGSGESALELRRADLDDFERGLRRRRQVLIGVSALAVLGAGGAAYWLLTRTPAPSTAEVEPNDETAQATLIRPGEITGLLGKRRTRADGDRDLFRLDVGAERQLLSLTLAAPPNIDVTLTLRNADGVVIAQVDDGPTGASERLWRRVVTGPVLLEVAQRDPAPGLPVENISDAYKLTVALDAPDPEWESEPNASAADASAISAGPLRGHLEARDDVDVLRWDGASGRYRVTIDAGAMPLVWRLADGVPRTGSADVELTTGATIRIERADHDRPHAEVAPALDGTWTVSVGPATGAPATTGSGGSGSSARGSAR
jgi:tRNA A-37 threonylcarbamoyl transferase component Bud32